MQSAKHTPDGGWAAEWRDVSVRYPYAHHDAVGPASLKLVVGERLLLLGPSGSGKSTLLSALTGLVPQTIPARVGGSISLFGEDVWTRQPAQWATTVARFFQDAALTLCGMRVEDEIAFALENRALPEDVIATKVTAAMAEVGLPKDWRKRRTGTLSGGEKQLVALAATLAQGAPLFVADEPTAHLAPAAATRLHQILMARGAARTVLIIDHRLDGLIGSVDRVAVLGSDGRIFAEGPPASFFRDHHDELDSLGIWLPLASRLDAALRRAGLAAPEPSLTMEHVLRNLDRHPERERAQPLIEAFVAEHSAAPDPSDGEVVARLIGADCAPLFGPAVLKEISVEIRAGECLGILGANGAGKSTLGASLAGLLRLKGGRRQGAPGAIAFQNSENQFVTGSVRDEIVAALDRASPVPERLSEADRIAASWNLAGLECLHPFELSQGQKRRLALATLTATDRWRLLVLDEPTAGLDAHGASMVSAQVEKILDDGRAVAVITHDMDLALRLCHRSIIVGEGRILAEGRTAELLQDRDLLARAGLAEPTIAPALRWLDHVGATC
ncbi:ABC transporter ATP-binding protein [Mesorhizobium sp. 1B3]|uniref:ABC transporter ATP-binding protein n=1 Tax=Mesorhizobium sp. 1B3 TaxID=3243599 RepID=UPI003D973B78